MTADDAVTIVAASRSAAPARSRRPSAIRPGLRVEKSLLRDGCARLAAMDEVGRGALAGPVTVGVVVVTGGIGRVPPGLRDSKLLTPRARQTLIRPVQRWSREFAVGHASAAEIDAIGIMSALRAAAGRALAQLDGPVDAILLDGKHNYLRPPPPPEPEPDQDGLFVPPVVVDPVRAAADRWSPIGDDLPVHLKIKADLTCAGVAGASVLAKTARDALLTRLDRYFPEFGFAINKGYATPEHRAALLAGGPSEVHRRTWRFLGNDVGDAVPVDDGGSTDDAVDPAVQDLAVQDLADLAVHDPAVDDPAERVER